MGKDRFLRVTPENIGDIHNESEKVVATACLRMGVKVFREIPLQTRVVDFLVFFPGEKKGVLVEVTHATKDEAERAERKRDQIKQMRGTGREWVLLCREDLDNIKKII